MRTSVSDAELLARFVSPTPEGAVIVAVFTMAPGAVRETVVATVKVAVPPASRSAVVLMLPTPVAEPQEEPALATQAQDTFRSSRGNVSVTVAPVTAAGPAFDATML